MLLVFLFIAPLPRVENSIVIVGTLFDTFLDFSGNIHTPLDFNGDIFYEFIIENLLLFKNVSIQIIVFLL